MSDLDLLGLLQPRPGSPDGVLQQEAVWEVSRDHGRLLSCSREGLYGEGGSGGKHRWRLDYKVNNSLIQPSVFFTGRNDPYNWLFAPNLFQLRAHLRI